MNWEINIAYNKDLDTVKVEVRGADYFDVLLATASLIATYKFTSAELERCVETIKRISCIKPEI